MYRYNIATDTWTTLSTSAPMPQAALMASAVYYPPTNKIYVFGGSTRTPDPVVVYDVTRIYDIATNTWTMGPTMPATRQQMASGYNTANGKIYLNGGFETSTIDSVQATTWEFDPVANTFTVKAPSPAMQAGPASEVINGKLYVAGGRTNPDEVLSNTWGYDIATNTWTAADQLADMPMAKNVPGRAVVQGQLYSIGGTSVATFDGLNDVSKYDPATNAWSPVPLLNTARSFTSSVAVGNTIIAAGGRANGTPRSPAWRSSSSRASAATTATTASAATTATTASAATTATAATATTASAATTSATSSNRHHRLPHLRLHRRHHHLHHHLHLRHLRLHLRRHRPAVACRG